MQKAKKTNVFLKSKALGSEVPDERSFMKTKLVSVFEASVKISQNIRLKKVLLLKNNYQKCQIFRFQPTSPSDSEHLCQFQFYQI